MFVIKTLPVVVLADKPLTVEIDVTILPKYVVADIVDEVKPCVNTVLPVTVPPLNGK